MLLIATDEAGYGPKLGPLVIAGTAWRIADELASGENVMDELAAIFEPLRVAKSCGGTQVVVDDSKAVYKPSSGLAALHAVVSASLHWCGRREVTLDELLPWLTPEDYVSLADAPWLQHVDGDPFLSPPDTQTLLEGWKSTGLELLDVKARLITAERFNAICGRGSNKSDLLSQCSLELVRALVDEHGNGERSAMVFCDRHGGRRYYGGVLLHTFPDAQLNIIAEKPQQSEYRLHESGMSIDVFFTVKGDSFTPVALSSMHAKYLRERMMGSLNAYFANQDPTLKPTAGYPVDADRFLSDIEPIIRREGIDRSKLIRCR